MEKEARGGSLLGRKGELLFLNDEVCAEDEWTGAGT